MNVIILGANHYNTLGLIWSFSEGGHDIYLILRKERINYVAKSNKIKGYVLFEANSEIVDKIKQLAVGLNDKPLLVASEDVGATIIDNNSKELSAYCFLEGGRLPNSINKYRDKNVSNKLAEEIGFDVPKSIILTNCNGALPVVMTFPLIVKCNNSLFGGKAIQRVCENETEFRATTASISNEYYPILVQEFIQKDYELVLFGCSVGNGEQVYSAIANRKIRYTPNGLGTYGKSIRIEDDVEIRKLKELASKYLKKIGYTGLWGIDFISKNNKYYFIEINLRNDGISYLSTSCGFNLPEILCKSITGENIDIKFDYKSKFFIHPTMDFMNVLRGNVGLFKWSKQVLSNCCYATYNRKDKNPFFYSILAIILRRL